MQKNYGLSPMWLIVLTFLLLLVGLRIVPPIVGWVADLLHLPTGWVLFFAAAVVLVLLRLFPGVLSLSIRVLDDIFSRFSAFSLERLGVERPVVPTGEGDFDEWIVEGLVAFGPRKYNAWAGILSGVCMPWILLLLTFLYAQVSSSFAESWLSDGTGLVALWHIVGDNRAILLEGTLILGLFGWVFALLRRIVIRKKVQASNGGLSRLYDTRVGAVLLGWAGFAMYVLARPTDTNLFALLYVPLLVGVGLLFSLYFHFFHTKFLFYLYLKKWAVVTEAVAKRILAHIGVQSIPKIAADESDGSILFDGLPQSAEVSRLKDLIARIPGVDRIEVRQDKRGESGSVTQAGLPSEILTIYVKHDATNREPASLITLGNRLFTAGGLSGLLTCVAGLLYVALTSIATHGIHSLSTRGFWGSVGDVLMLSLVVEVVGFVLGFFSRLLLLRKAQNALPTELAAVLQEHDLDLKEFQFGGTSQEVHVTADLTRQEAIDMLTPVAAKYGVHRILLTTAAGYARQIRPEVAEKTTGL